MASLEEITKKSWFAWLGVIIPIVSYILSFGTLIINSRQDLRLVTQLILQSTLMIIFFILSYKYKTIQTIPLLVIFLIFILTIVYIFGSIYSLPINANDYFKESGNTTQLSFLNGMYFSAVTITTLGYGDISPHGIFRLFAVVEVLLGLICTGLLIFFVTESAKRKD